MNTKWTLENIQKFLDDSNSNCQAISKEYKNNGTSYQCGERTARFIIISIFSHKFSFPADGMAFCLRLPIPSSAT